MQSLPSIVVALINGQNKCVALKRLYLKHNCEDVELNNIQYEIVASNREKFKISNTIMGVYASSFVSIMKLSDAGSEEFNKDIFESFWDICNQRTIHLLNKIRKNQEFEFNSFYEEYVNKPQDQPFPGNCYSLSLSNIEVMKNVSSNKLRIVQHYL